MFWSPNINIFGKHNPGGRLPVTWYPQDFTNVLMTDMRMRADPATGYPGRTYRFYTGELIFKFGYGLSYSSYSYKFTSATKTSMYMNKTIGRQYVKDSQQTISYDISKMGTKHCQKLEFSTAVRVSNHGPMAGRRLVLMFLRRPNLYGGRPMKQLIDIESVQFAAGEKVHIEFALRPCKHLSRIGEDGLIFGYDIGISGGATSMDSFLLKFFPSVYRKEKEDTSTNQYCKFDSQLLTAFTSSLYLAALISFFASKITKVFMRGRKWSMFGGGITFLVGSALNGAAVNVLMLILGRILLRVGVGFANQIIVGTLMAVIFGTSGNAVRPSKIFLAFVLAFVCTYVAGFAWSWGPLGWLVPSEIFPLEIRSAGQSITVSVNMLITFIIAQTFLTMLYQMKFGMFFFFGGWVFIMTTSVAFFLLETKNVPIEEMMLVWK